MYKFYLSKSIKLVKAKDNILKKDWYKFFREACPERRIDQGSEQTNSGIPDVRYWFKIFKKKTEPAFLKNSSFKETKYGYCLAVQYSGYIILSSKFCSLKSETIRILGTEIPYEEFTRSLTPANVEFEKISLSNSTAMSGIRNRVIEGKNLERNYTPIYSTKNIIKSFKVRRGEDIFTQNPTNSKVTYHTAKVDLDDFLNWCKNFIDSFDSSNTSEYLKKYAVPVNFEKISSLTPESIIVDIDFLNELDGIKFIDKDRDVELDFGYIMRKYSGVHSLVPVSKQNKTYKILPSLNYKLNRILPSLNYKLNKLGITTLKKFRVIGKNNKYLTIKINKKTITYHLDFPILVQYTENGEEVEKEFRDIIKKNSTIIFNNISYFYYVNTLFFDSQLVNESLLDVIVEESSLTTTKSEKGKGTLSEKSTSFSNDSVFCKIENYLRQNSWDTILCDDMGNEHADYIAFDSNRIGFFHAKHGTSKKSASMFHDVVSQALKNLIFLSDVNNIDMQSKKKRWQGKYSAQKCQTQIDLIRTPKIKNIDGIITTLIEVNKKIDVKRYMVLVVDFLSKADLKNYVTSPILKKSDVQFQQMIWLLSSFVSTCQELNIIPQIICKP